MLLEEIKECIELKPYFSTDNGVLYYADCLEVMAKLPDKCVDLVLTDPPYRNEEDNQPTMDMRKNGGMDSFGNKLTDKQFKEIERVSDKQIIWGFNNFDFLPACKGFVVWEKHIPENFTMSMAEIAYLSENIATISKVFWCASNLEDRRHPTQKPLPLMDWCLRKYALGGGLIADFFMGSGTTAVACEKLGRQWIGVEISEKYCEIAAKRIQAENNQLKLFT